MSATIPRIIHQIWLGPDPFPEKYARFRETWRDRHAGWEFRFWDESNLPGDLRCAAIAERLRSPVERCDLFRLECLWREGGVYVDCDFECVRPIDELLDGVRMFVGEIGPNRVNHALMGATKAHPLLDAALSEVRPRTMFGYDKNRTGPPFFTRILREHGSGVTVYPSAYFHPASDEERRTAYAIHHADRSWQDADDLRLRLAKAHRNLEKAEERRRRAEARVDELERELRRHGGGGMLHRLASRLRSPS
jgi:inositol phosphorylceramide mannosyltransferase catalytic subunit